MANQIKADKTFGPHVLCSRVLSKMDALGVARQTNKARKTTQDAQKRSTDSFCVFGEQDQTMQDIQHTCQPAQSCAVGARGLLRGTRQERLKYEKRIKDKSRKKGPAKARTTRQENRNTHAAYLKRHLGMRENPYTWPTCTCPLKPDNVSIREIWGIVQNITKPDKQCLINEAQHKAGQTMQGKQKRHLEEDALKNQISLTKRQKLVRKPKKRPKRAGHTMQEPESKCKNNTRRRAKSAANKSAHATISRTPTARQTTQRAAER